MDIFAILTMISGLALFLYGMHMMGNGLESVSGGKLESILARMTSKKIFAILLGAGVTGVIQSSSATTVMVVGFVNSGIMKLKQAIGIIMGANIGTTITAWILSLSGIEGDNLFVKLLKPTSFSPLLAAIGVALLMFSKSEKKKNVGTILIGFAILMFGMDSMSGAVKPLAEVPEFTSILTMFSNPILGVLAGAILTAVIQSSSASVGILQALCLTGAISFGSAVPIIMGQNIGTCITAILSCIGAKRSAKRAAVVHLYFNLIGTVIFLVVFYTLNAFIHFEFLNDAAGPAGIAIFHSLFNISATLLFAPFTNLFEFLALKTIKETKEEREVFNEFQLLDSRFLETPSYAIEVSKTLMNKMSSISKESYEKSMLLFNKYESSIENDVTYLENKVDKYEDALSSYLVKLSGKNLSNKDTKTLSLLLHCMGDFERISDHSVNIMQVFKELKEKKLEFSKAAISDLKVYNLALNDIVERTFKAFSDVDVELAKTVEPLEEVIDFINNEVKNRHVMRLREGTCTVELGFILSDLITNMERVSDHCSNIAVYIIQQSEENLEIHNYLDNLKSKNNPIFMEKYAEFMSQYELSKK